MSFYKDEFEADRSINEKLAHDQSVNFPHLRMEFPEISFSQIELQVYLKFVLAEYLFFSTWFLFFFFKCHSLSSIYLFIFVLGPAVNDFSSQLIEFDKADDCF